MIYELRIYTLRPGMLSAFVTLNADVAWPIRRNDYGTLVGCWTSEIGPLGRFYHLWSYPSVEERRVRRAALVENPDMAEYGAQVHGMVARRENLLLDLDESIGMHPVEGRGHVYELRFDRAHDQALARWTGRFRLALPARERFSKIVALWTSESGQLDMAVHLWVYDDLRARSEAVTAASADPVWATFEREAAPHLVESSNVILLPTVISPLQ